MLLKPLELQSKKDFLSSHGHYYMKSDVIDTDRGYILTGKTSQRLKLDNLPLTLYSYYLIFAYHILHVEALRNYYVF